MRQRRRGRWVGIVPALVALALLGGGPPAASAAPSPCAQADLLLGAGLLREAALAYHAVARRARRSPEAASCVERGLAVVARARDRRARALKADALALHLPPGVAERLERAVRIAPRAELIPLVMARGIARRRGERGILIARALHRAGYGAEANAVLRATLSRHLFVSVPHELRGSTAAAALDLTAARALSRAGFDAAAAAEVRRALLADPTATVPAELSPADHRTPLWNDVRGVIGPWIRSIAEFALAVLIAVLALVLLGRIVSRLVRRRLVIEPFRAREEAFGRTTSAAVRENHGRLQARRGGMRLKLVDPGAEQFESLPSAVTDVVPQAAFVNAVLTLLDRILPTRTWRVTGELLPAHPVRGAGLQVALSRRLRSRFEEQTFWENDFGPWNPPSGDATQENYDRLAIPAASWLIFTTAKQRLRRRVRDFVILGSRDWRSYALFAVGAQLQEKGNPRDARPRYEQALGIAPDSYGAEMQLAVAQMQTAALEEANGRAAYARASDRLHGLCDTVTDSTDPMWYRIRYNYAVALLLEIPPGGVRLGEAGQIAVELCAEIVRRNQRLARRFRRSLASYLTTVEPTALVLLASILREEGRASEELPTLRAAELREQLERAHASEEPGQLDHAAIVRYVLEEHPHLKPDTRYNLARYYLRMDARPEAAQELRIVLDRGDAALRRLVQDNAAQDADLAELLRELRPNDGQVNVASDGDARGLRLVAERLSIWVGATRAAD